MNMDVKTVNYILNVAKPIKSIYEDVKGVDNLTVGDTIADNRIDFENDIAAADERRYISQVVGEAINELPEEEKEVIRMSYLEGLPYTAIAQKVDKSVEWVRQLKRKGLRKLRQPGNIKTVA